MEPWGVPAAGFYHTTIIYYIYYIAWHHKFSFLNNMDSDV